MELFDFHAHFLRLLTMMKILSHTHVHPHVLNLESM